MESRIAELEAKLSLSEDLLDELNRMVYRQQQQIDQLLLEVQALRQQIRSIAPPDAPSLRDEIPPHY